MVNLGKFRLPYREDTAFSLLALAVFIVPLAFSAYTYENFESVKFGLFVLCVFAAFAVFLFRRQPGPATAKGRKYIYALLTGFILWAAVSGLLSVNPLGSLVGSYYRYTSGLVFYAMLGAFIFLLLNLLDQGKFEYLLKILVLDGFIVGVVSFLQGFNLVFYGGPDVSGFFRGPSLLGNTDFSAMFMAAVLPLACYFLLLGKNYWARVYYALTAFFIILSSLILASRGALLGMVSSVVVALILAGLFKLQKKVFWLLLSVAVIAGVCGFFFLKVSRPDAISSIVVSADSNTVLRFYAWDISLKGIAAHPLFGVGPGNFAHFFETSRPPQLAAQIGVFDDAHNIFLQLAATGGLPLLLMFLALIWLAVADGLKVLRSEKSFLPVTLLAVLACWFTATFFNPVPIPMYLLLAVILCGLWLPFARERRINFPKTVKYLFIVVSCLALAWGLVGLVSESLLGAAVRAYYAGDYRAGYQLASAAYAINPTNGEFLIFRAANSIALDKDPSQITGDITKLENLQPNMAESFLSASNLYNLLYLKNKNQEYLELAAQTMVKSFEFDPYFPARYGQLALYYYQLGQIPSAKAALLKDLSFGQDDFSADILLARVYQLENNRSGTVDALTRAFKINPDIPQLKYLLQLAKNWPNLQQVPIQIAPAAPPL